MNKVTQWFYRQKEGALLGSLLGVCAYFYMYFFNKTGLNAVYSQSLNSPSLLDKVFSTTAPSILANWKTFLAYVLIGLVVGIIIDAIWHPER